MKMKNAEPKADVGVIVGRFQVPHLHEAHIDLIQGVVDRHTKVLVFLGLSPLKTTLNNPLDFEARKQMLLERFPDLIVLYIKDEPLDDVWSKKLDDQIKDVIGPNQTVLLYGGRDSFLPHYHGKSPIVELEPDRYISGTELRKLTGNRTKASADFRAGVVWAVENQFRSVCPTVDVAIYDSDRDRVLLVRKPNETLFRFVGGHAETSSGTYEEDARREVMEETSVAVDRPIYLDSFVIDDWRYRSEADKIKSLFFVAYYLYGRPEGADDVKDARWFTIAELKPENIVPEHLPLLNRFLAYLTTKQEKK